MLGYDKQQVSSLGMDMVMYLGELAANTILDTEDNNINTELEEYTTKGDRNNVFSMIKVLSNFDTGALLILKYYVVKMVMDRSSMRGEQIKSSLLDQNLTEKMIQQLSEKTGMYFIVMAVNDTSLNQGTLLHVSKCFCVKFFLTSPLLRKLLMRQ